MTKLLRAIVTAGFLCAVAAPKAYAGIEIEPGQWQDTETGEEDGKPVKPVVTSECMSPEEAKDPVKALSVMKDMKDAAAQCKKLDVKQSGNVVNIAMLCGDPKEFQIDLTGTYTFIDRKHYTGSMKSVIVIAGNKATASKSVDSKWIGPCKTPAGKK